MASNTSFLVNDIVSVFESSYTMHADLFVSCMFANLGLYTVADNSTKDTPAYSGYERSLCEIHTSHIWEHLPILSPMLKRSVLHTFTTMAAPYLYVMDDQKQSKGMLMFKRDVVAFITKYSKLLAYCDVEGTELFNVVNARFAYDNEQYLEESKQATAHLRQIFHTYRHRIPRVAMFVLDDIEEVINIRSNTGGSLICPTDFSIFPQFPKFQKEEFHENVLKFAHGTVKNLMRPLTYIYRQLVPFYVLSGMRSILVMHGEKTDEMESLADKMNMDALDAIQVLKGFLNTHAVTPLKKEFHNTWLFAGAFDIVNDNFLFEEYSLQPIGSIPMHVFKLLHDMHQQNIRLLIVADLIYCGVYDSVSLENQVNVELLGQMITTCESSLDIVYDKLREYSCLQNIIHDMTDNIEISLKRVKRYERYQKHVLDMEELPCYIDMIFGDVRDDDGEPTTCAICLDDACEKKECWYQLPCQHKFHMDCVSNLLSCTNEDVVKCPLCRVQI